MQGQLTTIEFMVATGPINFQIFVTQKVGYQTIETSGTTHIFYIAVVGFKCPTKVDSGSPAARFWPFPRFPVHGDCHRLITCVEGYPRLITCGEDKVFDETTLTCEEAEYASSKCNNFGK